MIALREESNGNEVGLLLPKPLFLRNPKRGVDPADKFFRSGTAKFSSLITKFDFRIFDSLQDMAKAIRAKASDGYSARLVAGFCWPWSDPDSSGQLVDDVKLDGFSMPWDAKPDAGRLTTGIPKSNFWASDPNGINQVGCVYTAQGFEFDYFGVIFGRDLFYDGGWRGDREASQDPVVKKAREEEFVNLVKQTYRLLLTRGMKGCYVFFEDEDTRDFFLSRIKTAESHAVTGA